MKHLQAFGQWLLEDGVNTGLKIPKNAGLKFLTLPILEPKAEGIPQPSFSPPYEMNHP